MSSSSGVESFDPELLRALLNAQAQSSGESPFVAARSVIEAKLKENISSENPEKIDSKLLILLNKLEVSSQILNQLKDSFTEIKKIQEEKFSELTFIVEKDFESPEKLAQALKNYDHSKILKEINALKEHIKNDPSVNLKDKEVIENLEKNIKLLLREIKLLIPDVKDFPGRTSGSQFETEKGNKPNQAQPRLQETQRPQAREALKPHAREFPDAETRTGKKIDIQHPAEGDAARSDKVRTFEKALDRLSLDKQGMQFAKATTKLLEVLHVVAERKDYGPEEQEKLVKVIKQQILQLQNVEESIKKLLISPSGESQLTTLVKVLENIKLEEVPANNPEQLKYKEFIQELKLALNSMIAQNTPEADIKNFLLTVLEKIYKEFKLEPLNLRILKDMELSDISEFLKPEQIVNLKLIESQIKLIIDSPKESMFDQVKKDGSPSELKLVLKSRELSVLIDMMDKLTEDDTLKNSELFRNVDKFKTSIKDIIRSNTLPEAAEKEVRKLMLEFSESGIIKETLNKAEIFNINKPDIKQTEQLKLVADLIKEVLKNDASLLELQDIEHVKVTRIVTSASYKALTQLLKQLDQGMPNPGNATANEIVDFAGNLLDKIDRAKTGSVQKLNEHLTKALDKLETRFISQQPEISEMPLSTLNVSALRNLESMATSQDTFQKLNPIMRNMGEPVLLLFPFAMQGLMSKVEVSISARKGTEEEDGNSRGKKGKQGRQFHENVRFSVTLPNIGEIHVSVLHSDDEVMVIFDFKREGMSTRMEPVLAGLETVLRSAGYKKVHVSSSSKQVKEDRPNLLNVLLKNI